MRYYADVIDEEGKRQPFLDTDIFRREDPEQLIREVREAADERPYLDVVILDHRHLSVVEHVRGRWVRPGRRVSPAAVAECERRLLSHVPASPAEDVAEALSRARATLRILRDAVLIHTLERLEPHTGEMGPRRYRLYHLVERTLERIHLPRPDDDFGSPPF